MPRPSARTAERSADVARTASQASVFGDATHERVLARLGESGLTFLLPLTEHLAVHRRSACERAFVTLSYSQSLDGSIAVSRSTPCSLSCARSLEMTHMVRSLHDGVLVGINTILSDDPRLTVRYCEGEDPQPVVLDSTLRFPERARLLRHRTRRPIIVTTASAPPHQVRRLEDGGARVFTVRDVAGRVDLAAAMKLLRTLDVHTVMVEGGATIINAMLTSALVDYCVLTIAPKLIGGVKAVESLCQPQNAAPLAIDDCRYHILDRDLIAYGRLSRG